MDPVVIIGGGPAGAAMGCYLSQAGIKNVIFEKAMHPRPHVGESLVVATTRVFQDIGFIDAMNKAGFIRKYGASWHPPVRGGTVAIEFREFPIAGVNQDFTYHVDRSKMDLLLLKHADEMGSKVCQGTTVKEVLFDEHGFACGVKVDVAGRSVSVPASFVVDASGRGTLLGNRLGWKKSDPHFNQFCVHAWFTGVDRGPAKTAHDIHIHFLPVERGWVWQIPIDKKTTSMGVVAEKSVFKEAEGDYAAWFHRLCKMAPDIAHAMRRARQINDFKIEADYSYRMEHFCGDGFAIVGDAARFVDPIFSSGVSVALCSAKLAAARIVDAWQRRDFSRAILEPYEAVLHRGTEIWYEFICLYYKLLPTFTYFIQHGEYRQELFALLQGDVYDRQSVAVLGAMRDFIRVVEENEDHAFHRKLDAELSVA